MKKLLLIARFLFIIFFGIIYHTSAHPFTNLSQHVGKGELKIPKSTFDLLEFYFSGGRYGKIYNNPQYDWQKKMIKTVWGPDFFIISQNGKGIHWYYAVTGANYDNAPNYLGKARDVCTKRGYGECFVFAIKNKIVWQNGINPKKGTRIKKKEARNGMVSIILKELGFYDGGITKTKKIEKKKEEKKKKPKITKKKETKKKIEDINDDNDIVEQIKDLKELYDSGVLTEEEFSKAKKKLLD